MHLDRCGIESEGLYLDANDLFGLQFLEHLVQNAVLRPAIHPRVDCVPATKTLRKTTLFAALFRNIQHRVQHLQIAQADVAPLHRQRLLDPFILRFCKLHSQTLTQILNSVNTP